MPINKIKGVVQNYAWGGTDYIPNLIGEPITGTPFAEYWMGAHDQAPALIIDSNTKLNEWIKKDPKSTLGEAAFEKFGRLPFLFKVLDVNDLLSIQVHPNKLEAEKGFAKENEAGIPLTAPFRNYKDDNHKPEIMVALGEFWLLHGFKPKTVLLKTLEAVEELNHLIHVFQTAGYKGLYKHVMTESQEETNRILKPLIDRIIPLYQSRNLDKNHPDYWAAKAFLTFCPTGNLDKGIYSIYFFNIVKVNRGEAVFQDAGVPHAYMEGQNIELMANSDNVLRGGLTPKHVDTEELLKHISFTETIPNILSGELQGNRLERIYKSPAPDFELSKIDLSGESTYSHRASSLEILLVLRGKANILTEDEKLEVTTGEAFTVTANTNYQIESEFAEVFKAKCPL